MNWRPGLWVPLLLAVSAATPAAAGTGIPFGPQHLPPGSLGATYTGTMWIAQPQTVLAELAAARRAGARVFLNLSTTKGAQAEDGTYSLERWKQRIDRFRSIDLAPYVRDGTILGHYVMDEPHSASNWGGKPVPFTEIEAAAKYSKTLWPDMTTFVRTHPEFLEGASFRWVYVDAAWAQYTARRGDVAAYLKRQVETARRLDLGLVVGLNLLNGGTAESGIPGFHKGRWAMSAGQIRSLGRALAAEPYACAFSMWKYDKADPSYLQRADIKAALAEVAEVAANHPRTSCRVH
jgi:hypothetical protein